MLDEGRDWVEARIRTSCATVRCPERLAGLLVLLRRELVLLCCRRGRVRRSGTSDYVRRRRRAAVSGAARSRRMHTNRWPSDMVEAAIDGIATMLQQREVMSE